MGLSLEHRLAAMRQGAMICHLVQLFEPRRLLQVTRYTIAARSPMR